MPITNTITTSFVHEYYGSKNDVTKPYYEYLQTEGSKTTQGAVPIFASATASDDFILDYVNIGGVAGTAGSYLTVYAATTPVASFPVHGASTNSFESIQFGRGLVCGTTTTYTVYAMVTGATTTVQFVAGGWRKV